MIAVLVLVCSIAGTAVGQALGATDRMKGVKTTEEAEETAATVP